MRPSPPPLGTLYLVADAPVSRADMPKLLRDEIKVHIIQSRDHILNTYAEKISEYAEVRPALRLWPLSACQGG